MVFIKVIFHIVNQVVFVYHPDAGFKVLVRTKSQNRVILKVGIENLISSLRIGVPFSILNF